MSTPPKPRAILVVSAHWTTSWEIGITSAARHRLIYDFAGFPDRYSRVQYPAPGAPALADRVTALLAPAPVAATGFTNVFVGALNAAK